MKKTLLLIAMSVPFVVAAQADKGDGIKKMYAPTTTKMVGECIPADTTSPSLGGLPSITEDIYARNKRGAAQWKTIGVTSYDLQTNASIGRRVQLHSDGTVTAVWTTASGIDPFPDRGTGLNYFDGTDWRSTVSNRLEPATGADNRTGWPNIAVINDGTEREIVMGHVALSDFGGFRVTTNTGIGSEAWTTAGSNVLTGSPQIPGRPIWGRMATDGGMVVHVIANYADSAADQPFTTKRAGVRDPLTYSRSEDGGKTWVVDKMILPGYDSTLTFEGGGDQYAIDVKGDVVAILAGGLSESIVLWKSTDAGQNFTKIDVQPFPFAPYNADKIIGTDVPSNDGSVDVLIDNNDNVHCFWGYTEVTQRDLSRDSSVFNPSANKLMHWDEVNGTVDSIAAMWDRNNDGTLELEPGTARFTTTFDGNGNPVGAARTGSTTLTTMPSAAIDAAGNIYCVYSAPVEFAATDDRENYRDVYVTYSTDGGATWNGPQNLTDNPVKEDVFACAAKQADNFLHIIFQRDEFPGTVLQNNDPAGSNDILYGAIPTSEILADNIGPGRGVGIDPVSNDIAKVFVVSQNYPNPFSNETNVTLYLNQPGTLNLQITNSLGQVVKTTDYDNLQHGTHTLVIDGSDLTPGIYFYTLTINGYAVTKRMQVQ